MKKKVLFSLIVLIAGMGYIVSSSCKREGCTNPKAVNYDSKAKTDDGSCVIYGCTNPDGENYDPDATDDDGSCVIWGCTNPNAENYNPEATDDDGSCIILGCTDPLAINYNPSATQNDGSCVYPDPEGEGVFWTDADYGTGYISIYVEGSYKGQITGFYETGSPACGASGCVTFEDDPGTYSFYGVSTQGYYWEGSINLTNGGCSKMRLYVSDAKSLFEGSSGGNEIDEMPGALKNEGPH